MGYFEAIVVLRISAKEKRDGKKGMKEELKRRMKKPKQEKKKTREMNRRTRAKKSSESFVS